MRSAALRHKITIQELTEAQNGTGEIIKTWVDVMTVRSAYEPLTGKEQYAEDQLQATSNTRFRIRYRDGIKPAMRIVYDSRFFDIKAALNLGGRSKQIHLMAVERV